MRAEHERRGGAVARQRAQKSPRHPARILGIGEPRLFGQRAFAQPVEERQTHRADDADLWVMNVGVDKTG